MTIIHGRIYSIVKNFGKNVSCLFILASGILFSGCHGNPWNNPYPSADETANYYYTSFSEQPKTLDPAKSYTAEEAIFIGQIYEPPLQYHYLLRPYTLIPLTANEVPKPILLDKQGRVLAPNAAATDAAVTIYKVHIKPGIYYQPHPAFARNSNGEYYYLYLTANDLKNKHSMADFSHTGTRELIADDYVYEIKRLADPRVQSPIYGLLSKYILGMENYNATLIAKYKQLHQTGRDNYFDLRALALPGVQVLDRYTFTISIKGYYPQFIYWLAMNFFAPIPWEADAFYSQPGMERNNLTLDWYPIGTGPYVLVENNPNRQMVLSRNANFHGEKYPSYGMPQDFKLGLLSLAGKSIPFIDKYIFVLEKESIPRWNKFLQGYYDQSPISTESFTQAIQIAANGQPAVTPDLKEKGVSLRTTVAPSVVYTAFNMLDSIVGGNSERARKLRLAISIALDTEEYITIFLNGRGIPAQGLIPPGIFSYRGGPEGIDPYIYQWKNGHAVRRSIEFAKQLLAEAGYPNGRDPVTEQPLLLNYDAITGGSGDDRSYFAWLSKQFAKLGIELQVRDTQYNRFQDKVRTGQVQIFSWAWNADYPDPENFLFLFYGPNGKVKFDGENSGNYQNDNYDALFDKMRILPNGPVRQAVIDQMQAILSHDAPLIWLYFPRTFLLSQSWVDAMKTNEIANNSLKYYRLDPQMRMHLRKQWNPPIFWPIVIGLLIMILALLPVIFSYWNKQHRSPKQSVADE